jgi:hypothetical protein
MTLAPSAAPPGGSGLSRLLELEASLEERLAAARRQAEALRAQGAAAAAAARAESERRCAAEEEALAARIAGEHSRAETALRAELAQQAARYRGIGPERVEGIARELLCLLRDAAAPAEAA